jgi:hypothetical protein
MNFKELFIPRLNVTSFGLSQSTKSLKNMKRFLRNFTDESVTCTAIRNVWVQFLETLSSFGIYSEWKLHLFVYSTLPFFFNFFKAEHKFIELVRISWFVFPKIFCLVESPLLLLLFSIIWISFVARSLYNRHIYFFTKQKLTSL